MREDSTIDGISIDEILFWPPGDINTDCLDRLLNEAHTSGLKNNDKLSYYRHKRTNDVDLDYPTYASIKEQRSVRNLKRLYSQINGYEFTPRETYINHNIWTILFDSKTGQTYVVDIGS